MLLQCHHIGFSEVPRDIFSGAKSFPFSHVETTHVLDFGIPHLMSDMSQDRQGDMGICVPKEVLVLDVAISVATCSEYIDIHMNMDQEQEQDRSFIEYIII